MGYDVSRARDSESDSEDSESTRSLGLNDRGSSSTSPTGVYRGHSQVEAEAYYGRELESAAELRQLQRLEDAVGSQRLEQWLDEGMPIEAMGTPSQMEAFRERKGTPVPWNVEEHNEQSVQRSADAAADASPVSDAGVPESVRDAISSPGQSLDVSIQRAMEERMGDSFGDVRVHAGPTAARACEEVDARAFTVGNHVAFNSGEYDPSSPEGQHVLAHELAHVRQQTVGAVSMLPREDVELEIDPDPELEREAETAAHRAQRNVKVGDREPSTIDVQVRRVQRSPTDETVVVHRLEGDASAGRFDEGGATATEAVEPLVPILGVATVEKMWEDSDVARTFLVDLAREAETFSRLRDQAKQSDSYPGDTQYVKDLALGIQSFSLEDELESSLKVRDVRQNVYNESAGAGQPVAYLVDTDKWVDGTEFDQGAHDWKHVVARHVVPKDEDDELGARHANDQTTMFPPSLTRAEIATAIEIAARNGSMPDEHDPAKVVYSGSKLERFGIDEMKVVRHPKTGQIVTAHPLEGEAVVEWGEIKARYDRGGGDR